MHKKLFMACLAALVLFLAMQGTVLAETPDVVHDPHALEEAIQAAHDQGLLNKDDPEGYLGIPGAPQISLVLAFFWACLVGWVFSTVGAFGGIMAGIGHITIYGLGDYADTFKGESAELNTAVTDTIRVGNQFLVGFSALVSTINYWKLGRLVLPVGIALAVGSILGSYIIPTITAGRISFTDYVGVFGIFVLVLGCYMLYQTTPRGQKSKKKAKQAADAFEQTMKRKRSGEAVDTSELGVKVTSLTPKKMSFTFYGVEFSFNPLFPILGGFVIAAIAVSGCRRRIHAGSLHYRRGRSAHVPGRRHLGPGRSGRHDHGYFELPGRGRAGALAADRDSAGGDFCGLHGRSPHIPVHSGEGAFPDFHCPGVLRGLQLHGPRLPGQGPSYPDYGWLIRPPGLCNLKRHAPCVPASIRGAALIRSGAPCRL